nr:immunoglobulin heavy chain junction region [Mus musculus]MBK4187108.1 immunoglobulin heavy chain junction region [Mus musculus]MBK4187109.1 immunoglobulin heavy chain junction region [Mus musculus]
CARGGDGYYADYW